MYSVFFSSLFRFVRWIVSFAHCRQTGQWLTVYVLFFIIHILFVVHVHKNMVAYLSESKQPSVYQHTHMWFGKKPTKINSNKMKRRETAFFSSLKIKWTKKRHRTLARIAQKKMQALHGAIWNRQNHNIDCCKFCRAVNPFARHKHTSFSSSFFFSIEHILACWYRTQTRHTQFLPHLFAPERFKAQTENELSFRRANKYTLLSAIWVRGEWSDARNVDSFELILNVAAVDFIIFFFVCSMCVLPFAQCRIVVVALCVSMNSFVMYITNVMTWKWLSIDIRI